jgi:hypothetical protein
MHAAKVAAAGAAVGAAAAAAKALASRQDGNGDQSEHDPEPQEPVDEADLGGPDLGDPEAPPEEQASGDDRPSEQGRDDRPPEPEPQRERQSEPRPQLREPPDGAAPDDAKAAVERARDQLETLLGRAVETVSAFERTHDGWLVTLEVVELPRIPESTDVLASYELELDDDRNLRRYARVGRYYRSQADRDQA